MKESTKQLKFDQKAAELLGMTLEEFRSKKKVQDKSDSIREPQAVFLFMERPDAFQRKKCTHCLQEFLTTYKFVSVCSTECRVASLEKMGITWNPLHNSDERWKRTQIPVEYSIPPQALAILLEIAKSQDQTNQTESVYDLDQKLEDHHSPQKISEILESQPNIDPQYNGTHKSPELSPLQLAEAEFLDLIQSDFP